MEDHDDVALVTGAAGFIGSHPSEAAGHDPDSTVVASTRWTERTHRRLDAHGRLGRNTRATVSDGRALVNGRTLVTRDSSRVSPGVTPVVAEA